MRLLCNQIPIKATIRITTLPLSRSSSLYRFCAFHGKSYLPTWPNFRPTAVASVRTLGASTSKSAAMGSVEEGIARRFWIKFGRESTLAQYTPFVVCLASGNLKVETFRHYLAQQVHFLKAFSQAYELAEECADDDDANVVINELRKCVLKELKLHDSFVQEWGSDLVLNSATTKYTDFLLATASGKVEGVKAPGKLATPFEKTKIAAYALGAMTPCIRLYAFLAEQFQSVLDHVDSSHPYKKWIDNYASDHFQASAQKTEDLLDKLSVPLTGEELDIMEKLYHQGLKLEIEFFSAQPLVQQTVLPLSKEHNPAEHRLMIFSDFDLTCTVVDSSAILAEIAILTAPKLDQNQPETPIAQKSSGDLRNTWSVLSRQYTEEYELCIASILASEKAKRFSYEDLHTALEQLSEFERRANSRVIESGVLKGIDLEDIKRAGEHLVLQDGCAAFFQNIINNKNLNANVHVLSYCWCGDLIRSAFSSGGVSLLNIHTNEFMYEGSVSTGGIVKKIESPIDKVQAFSNILINCKNNRKDMTVYIGDSLGDLLCLLQADVGIVVGSSSSLRRVGDHFGVSFIPLFSGLVKKQKEYVHGGGGSYNWKRLSGVLYTVCSWAEIHAFILGQ